MKNLITYFEDTVALYGENSFLWEKKESIYQPYSYRDTHQRVETMAYGLLSKGVLPGDRVALLSEGRPYWLIGELSVLYVAAITVPLSTKLEADNDLIFRINHSGSRFLIVSATQLPKIRLIRQELKSVEEIFVLPGTDEEPLLAGETELNELLALGEALREAQPGLLNERKQLVTPHSVANITYTSGTTADPKGIMLSHRNYTANVEQAFSFIDIPSHYITLAVLPWDHAFAHTACLYSFMNKGAGVASVQTGRTPMETLKNFSNNMLEIQPHVLMSVPAIAKNFKKNIEKGIQSKGAFTWILFRMGIRYAIWYNALGYDKGKGVKKLTNPLYSFFQALLFNKIKAKFGGRLEFFIGGGALLDLDLQKFFYALGIPMYQGYGLSEAAPIISANTPKHHKLGSSGKVVQNLAIRICDEKGVEVPVGQKGEIVVKGENVMLGYWQNDEATRNTIREGWLHTGDLGYLTPDGYLYVLGRFKSLLIGADGEKYSPEGIEEALTDHCPLIDQVMLHNNQNPYTIGLVVPSREQIMNRMRIHKRSIDSDQDLLEILEQIKQEVAQFKPGGKHESLFPQRWLPAATVLLPESFTEENKLLNSTMKMVRGKVEEYFAQEIEYAFTPEAKEWVNARNIQNLRIFLIR